MGLDAADAFEASQMQRLQKRELRTGRRGPIYTLSRIKNDSCGLCRLSKIAHTRALGIGSVPGGKRQAGSPACSICSVHTRESPEILGILLPPIAGDRRSVSLFRTNCRHCTEQAPDVLQPSRWSGPIAPGDSRRSIWPEVTPVLVRRARRDRRPRPAQTQSLQP